MYRIHHYYNKSQLDIRLIIDLNIWKSDLYPLIPLQKFHDCMKIVHDHLKKMFIGDFVIKSYGLESYETHTIWFQTQDEPFDADHLDSLLMIDYDIVHCGNVLFMELNEIISMGDNAFSIRERDLHGFKNYVAFRFLIDTNFIRYCNLDRSFVDRDFHFEGTFDV